MTYGWFGDPWPSGLCDDPEAQQQPTPVGTPCMYCAEAIEEGDQGVVYANGPVQHRECSLRSVVGSVAHLEQRCSCYVPGSEEGDPPDASLREGAIAASKWVEEHGLPL